MNNNLEIKKDIRKNIYCNNCGKYGHVYKKCLEPVTSYGIITFKLDNIMKDERRILNIFQKSLEDDTINIFNNSHNNRLVTNDRLEMMLFHTLENRIKFLLIRRKHTLGYIEFIRGRYRVENVEGIIFLFQQMTPEEIKKIGESSFDELWKEMWNDFGYTQYRQQEYKHSKENFERLKYSNDDEDRYLGLKFYVEQVKPTWSYAEWGFPKGRRNAHETNLDCAKREYREETGLSDEDYVLLNIEPIVENIVGTNGRNYKHIYYVGIDVSNKIPSTTGEYKPQASEVGDIGWTTYSNALGLFRVHHENRKRLLTELYMFILKNISNIIRTKIKK
jgi:8-oxo-dGTP pyrophosphatase MutT (NUDIX family)